MDYLNYWRLLDVLTIEQATLLILDQDPENVLDARGYHPVAMAIEHGLENDAIKGVSVKRPDDIMMDNRNQALYKKHGAETHGLVRAIPSTYKGGIRQNGDLYVYHVDHGESVVDVGSLKAWLQNRGIRPRFFFPDTDVVPGYMSPDHPRYSAKLAAAVKVWQAMDDDNLYSGKSPREGMSTWLESRYKELGLVWNGKINKTGIEEITKVANWITAGGAPTTPGDE